ncbi:HAMP domain-containing sensor histidine kinase [Paractinoplanes globisporus]|uniref:Oxygen sensor histidine kinase NreB n=1 Tax=Paractinoplanes globisporus TaxID=113565 RepID=A0ABW6W787_9ACTN|nr:sensor histidine kinase [Actinoplanes globisporus]
MRRGWGLRARMAGSYVLVTAAAVIVVEAVVLIVVVPGLLGGGQQDARVLVAGLTAREIASNAGERAAQLGRLPDVAQFPLGDRNLHLLPGQAQLTADGAEVRIPYTAEAQEGSAPMSMALLADPSGRIVTSSYPARYPVGGEIDAGVLAKLKTNPKGYGAEGREVLWSVVPVSVIRADARDVVGLVYVQIPVAAKIKASGRRGTTVWDGLSGQLGLGLLVLLGALPVGAVFGLLSTRRLLGRLRSLADSTDAVAAGDYERRVPVAGDDEVARLETGFNRMAERLAEAMATERALAGAGERARIARELHDSISQDLFSLRLLAGGLRRALPEGSPMHPRVEAMERTVTGTLREMQALLLELRPVALRGAGLIPALDELARAYRDRLGIPVETELEPVGLDPAAEPALLRVAQEALANAVKHARPSTVVVRLADAGGGRIELSVRDDGAGFDPDRAADRHGMGLGLMRERVAELGGELRVESAPDRGTTVRATLGPVA